MAKPVSDEEIKLRKRARRRLIGAIFLVLVVVVVLPMVLDREPKPVSQDIDIRIPSRESAGEFAPKAPIPPGPPAAGQVGQEAPAPAEIPHAQKPAAPPEAKATASAGHEPGKAVPRAEAKPNPEANSAFVVQLGAFSSPANAKQLQEALSANGIKSYTETVRTAEGVKIRVRAGPFPSRVEAEKVREKLAKLGHQGIVAAQ